MQDREYHVIFILSLNSIRIINGSYTNQYNIDALSIGQSTLYEKLLQICDSETINIKNIYLIFDDIEFSSTILHNGDVRYQTNTTAIQNIIEVFHACEINIIQYYIKHDLVARNIISNEVFIIDFGDYNTKGYLVNDNKIYDFKVSTQFSLNNLISNISNKFSISSQDSHTYLTTFFNTNEASKMNIIHTIDKTLNHGLFNILSHDNAVIVDSFCKSYISQIYSYFLLNFQTNIADIYVLSNVTNLFTDAKKNIAQLEIYKDLIIRINEDLLKHRLLYIMKQLFKLC